MRKTCEMLVYPELYWLLLVDGKQLNDKNMSYSTPCFPLAQPT